MNRDQLDEWLSWPRDSVWIKFLMDESDLEPLIRLEKKLLRQLLAKDVGKHVSHDLAGIYADEFPETELFLYGDNAENLFKEIHPMLQGNSLMKGAVARLTFRYGSFENSKFIEVDI